MSKASDAGKSFLAGVYAKLTPEQRTQAEAIFNSADATSALEVLGTGALAQPEINRQLDELRTKAQSLDDLREKNETWFAENKAALEEYLTIKPEYETLKTKGGGGNPPPTAGLTKEEISAALESRDRAFAGAMSLGMDLSAKHSHMFSEPLNMTELLSDPKLGQVLDRNSGRVYGLQDAYDTKHGTRVTEKVKAIEDARIKKLVDDGVAERMRTMPQNHPFPLRDSTPSPLDALDNKDRKPVDFNVDSAVAEYERLQATRNGAPS
jgi:hypothetical protein